MTPVLDRELAQWEEAGTVPRFWLRDDDAVEPTAALDRLIALVRAFDVPLVLAVIPEPATQALVKRLADEALVAAAVHGIAHRRHTAEPAKAVELGGDLDPDEAIRRLTEGRGKLIDLFGARYLDMLVPPWNRIAPDIAARVHECGFRAVSTASWHRTGTRLPELNTQVDLMDWTSRTGRPLEAVAGDLAHRLGEARQRNFAPVGLLAHHLVHDETAWATLERLLARFAGSFVAAGDLIAGQ